MVLAGNSGSLRIAKIASTFTAEELAIGETPEISKKETRAKIS
jgi:hypothetical protein